MPNVARMYDYYLGGTEARAVDQDAAKQVLAVAPQVRVAVAENRGFLERAVTFLAAHGIDQFLDLGSGLPTRRNVHEILADIAPGARVVYVDHDPDVVARSQELLAGNEDDPAAIIHRLRQVVPAGSLLALSHGARPDLDPSRTEWNASTNARAARPCCAPAPSSPDS